MLITFFCLLEFLHQVEDSVHIAEALLAGLSGFKGFLHFSDDLLEFLRAYEQEQFEDWSREILCGLADAKSGIRLETLHTAATLKSLGQHLVLSYMFTSFSVLIKGTSGWTGADLSGSYSLYFSNLTPTA